MLRLGNKDVLIMYLLQFLCLWCWLWASMYRWNTDYFMPNLLCFMAQLIFNFTTLTHVQYAFLFVILEKILSLIGVWECYIWKSFSESSQICGQDKNVNCECLFTGKFFYLVQCCTQIVSMLVMFGQFFLTSSNISEIYQHIFGTLVIYYIYTPFPAYLII